MKSPNYIKTPQDWNSTVTPSPYASSVSYSSESYTRQQRQKNRSNAEKNIFNNNSTQRSGIVQPVPRQVHNPYKRRAAEGHNEPTNTKGRKQHYRSSLAKQHPHRAGRIRVDKQFTTALSITSNHDEVEDEESRPESERNGYDNEESSLLEQNRFTASSNISIDDSLSTAKGGGGKSTEENASSDGDDDEDDDEDLLLFIPFEK